MLLTKRLTTFLSQNTTSALPTLLLLSPTGKLLSSSSPISASILRTQATLACSLWTLYQPTVSSVIPSVLPPQSESQSNTHPRGSDATLSSTTTAADHELASITVQLTHGVMVIRALSCGLLFVAIGPSSISPSSPSQTLRAQSISSHTHTSPPSSPLAHGENGYNGEGAHEGGSGGLGSSAPSETGSVRSTGRMASIMGIKRQAEEVGRWLDRQLEGFQLSSAEGR
ncbi:hypothetical protein N431DRAFT_432982 [Stipitochalara longipes BDJ]|nr:hypothetical protein N431DRAFT_432982 [Stipitochalara longipes BDJ]